MVLALKGEVLSVLVVVLAGSRGSVGISVVTRVVSVVGSKRQYWQETVLAGSSISQVLSSVVLAMLAGNSSSNVGKKQQSSVVIRSVGRKQQQ
ncbi:hypothetical protein Pcinc_017484 [Petrolisthes cinctipes]|uniref:Uncharacterized protein n=1 Tax=Petrolisthes cinctipes TaxID=88211 RepID=A0AAE1FQ74_PETCI|nr:hypothetical protein Pcinc_017484 [Petrolisthes cinctipes]